MSASFALLLVIVSLGSCFASYRLGQKEERERWRRWLRNNYRGDRE